MVSEKNEYESKKEQIEEFRRCEEMELKWKKFKEELENREGGKGKRKLSFQDQPQTLRTTKRIKLNPSEAASFPNRTLHSTLQAKKTTLALEYFPEGEGRQENETLEILALEYFPTILDESSASPGEVGETEKCENLDLDTLEGTGVPAVTRQGTQDRETSSQPRKVILKWRGKGKVPSGMTVMNLKEHFKTLSKKENLGGVYQKQAL